MIPPLDDRFCSYCGGLLPKSPLPDTVFKKHENLHQCVRNLRDRLAGVEKKVASLTDDARRRSYSREFIDELKERP